MEAKIGLNGPLRQTFEVDLNTDLDNLCYDFGGDFLPD